jgi:hypothetical protein
LARISVVGKSVSRFGCIRIAHILLNRGGTVAAATP